MPVGEGGALKNPRWSLGNIYFKEGDENSCSGLISLGSTGGILLGDKDLLCIKVGTDKFVAPGFT